MAWGPCSAPAVQGGKSGCPADINHSGAVDTADLLAVINAWGPCPPPQQGACDADIVRVGGTNHGMEKVDPTFACGEIYGGQVVLPGTSYYSTAGLSSLSCEDCQQMLIRYVVYTRVFDPSAHFCCAE